VSVLASRLRDIVGSGPAKPVPYEYAGLHEDGRVEPARNETLPEMLGGEWVQSRGQQYLVIDREYGPGYRHGRIPMMDSLPDADGLWPCISLLTATEAPRPGRLLFIDLETTGLAGGAGTYAFLVGCAWFNGAIFCIRQLFLATYSAERALLDGLAQIAGGVSGIVSFNGKSFDLPLIETRFLFHRMQPPFAGVPHVDMLHSARRLWRSDDDLAAGRTGTCRLSALERALCGAARESDVPAFEIPARYFTYVRTGDPRPLERVFEHNRLDLVSLAILTARATQLLEEGPSAACTAREALGLGRLYERGGLCDLAREAYALAAGIGSRSRQRSLYEDADVLTRAEALRSYAVLCRRQRLFADAADGWQRILTLRRCPPHITREATEALAVHHEHRLRDPGSARQFALQTLRFAATASRQHAVRHRLARLERKLGDATTYALQF